MKKIWNKNKIITFDLLDSRALIYNGHIFISLKIRKEMIGKSFGTFIVTKHLGNKIHNKKKSKK